jgi:hypothetical protein
MFKNFIMSILIFFQQIISYASIPIMIIALGLAYHFWTQNNNLNAQLKVQKAYREQVQQGQTEIEEGYAQNATSSKICAQDLLRTKNGHYELSTGCTEWLHSIYIESQHKS